MQSGLPSRPEAQFPTYQAHADVPPPSQSSSSSLTLDHYATHSHPTPLSAATPSSGSDMAPWDVTADLPPSWMPNDQFQPWDLGLLSPPSVAIHLSASAASDPIQESSGDQQPFVPLPSSLLSLDPLSASLPGSQGACASSHHTSLSGLQSLAMSSLSSSKLGQEDKAPPMETVDAANQLISKLSSIVSDIQQGSYPYNLEINAASKATRLLSKCSGFTDDQKARLRLYYCSDLSAALSLPDDDPGLLRAIFRNDLITLDKRNQSGISASTIHPTVENKE